MKVRLREFFPYIITMIVVFIFMILSSYVYTKFIGDTLNQSVYDAITSRTNNELNDFNNIINSKIRDYTLNSNTTLISNNETFELNEYKYIISKDSYFTESSDDSYYVFVNIDNKYLKINIDDIFKELEKNEDIYAYGLVSDSGELIYKKGISKNNLYDILRLYYSDEETINKYKESLLNKNDITATVSYNDSKSYLGTSYVSKYVHSIKTSDVDSQSVNNNIYLVTFYDANFFDERMERSFVLTLVYRISLLISFIIIFFDIALTVLRGNRLFTIRRKRASRRGIAIAKINKKGKVKFYARGRDTFGIEVGNFDIFRPVDGKKFSDCLKQDIRFRCEYNISDDELAYAEFVCIPHQGGYLIIATIITDEYNKELNLRRLTEENPITHIPNTNSLFKTFDSIKSEFFNKQVTLVKVKLVEFDQVSKTLGYNAGDNLLIESVKIIRDNLGQGFIYQDSNDTLILILNDTFLNNSMHLDKIFNAFNKPIDLSKSTIYVHLKMGVYELKNVLNKNFNLNDALDKATVALDRAYNQVALNLVKYDSNLEIYVNYHRQMEQDMHKALENNEFVMYYQPQYSLKERRIKGFESLIRWDNDNYRNVSPQEYIELAEKNGDIVEIGRIINKQVFKAAKAFEKYDIHLSINVSPAQLMQSGFIDELLTEFKANDLKKGSICVEITETYLMQNYQLMISKLNILKNNGFSIHLDDFGTGYSSMLYLKELPIDTIKTDREFIKNISSDEAGRIIEAEIIKMAKNLSLEVIAEGVETPIQVEYLQKFGADYIQGFIISKAVPYEEAIKLVEQGVSVQGVKKGGSK